MELPIDHVAIALPSIADALPTYELITGAIGSAPAPVPGQNVNVVFLGTGPCRLELIEPSAADSTIAPFLARPGGGLHHIAFRVPDLEAALARFAAAGFRLIDERPRRGAHNRRIAFLHPKSAHGVLIELVEAAHPVASAGQ